MENMSEADWINIVSRALLLCAELLQKIDRLKEQLQSLREKLQEREGYDTLYQHGPASAMHQTN